MSHCSDLYTPQHVLSLIYFHLNQHCANAKYFSGNLVFSKNAPLLNGVAALSRHSFVDGRWLLVFFLNCYPHTQSRLWQSTVYLNLMGATDDVLRCTVQRSGKDVDSRFLDVIGSASIATFASGARNEEQSMEETLEDATEGTLASAVETTTSTAMGHVLDCNEEDSEAFHSDAYPLLEIRPVIVASPHHNRLFVWQYPRRSKWSWRLCWVLIAWMVVAAPAVWHWEWLSRNGDSQTDDFAVNSHSAPVVFARRRHHCPLYRPPHATKTPLVPSRTPDKDTLHGRPLVAWLLTYAGSASSTPILQLVQERSGTTTATNYGVAALPTHSSVVSVHPEYGTSGPFVRDPLRPLPRHYILTSTHCGSLCVLPEQACRMLPRPEDDLLDFALACTSGRRYYQEQERAVSYDSHMVQRAVHVLRDPFATIVHRMQLALPHAFLNSTDASFRWENETNSWGNRTDLFHNWCRYLDRTTTFVLPDEISAYAHIPCAEEWYRFVQWHNMAVSIASAKSLPVHYVWVEDLPDTMPELMAFLQLDDVSNLDVTNYNDSDKHAALWWDDATRRDAARLMRAWASNATWDLIRHYLEPHLHEPNPKNHDCPKDEHHLQSENENVVYQDDDAISNETWAYNDLYGSLPPPEPNATDPEVVWLLSFPNSVRRALLVL
jgi:hypothetical protein